MALKGVLLDVDGTLVLSNDAHAQAWVDAFANFGYDISYEQVRPLMGMGGDHVITQLVPELDGKQGKGKELAGYRKDLFLQKYAPQLKPTQGSRQLVQKIQASELKLIIASSASNRELKVLLKAAAVDDLIEATTTADDAESSKPAPDIVEAALEKIQLAPDTTVMLGDTPYDIESAGKAGVGVIAFRCGGFSDAQLKGAIAIYDHPADLLHHYDHSVFANVH